MALTDTEVEIGGTTFYIEKMRGMEAFDFFDEARYEVLRNLKMSEIRELGGFTVPENEEGEPDLQAMLTGGFDMLLGLCKVLLSLSPKYVKQMRVQLFKHIEFAQEGSLNRLPVEGNEILIFEDASEVYELMLRALAVNFTGSSSKIDSLLEEGKALIARSKL